MYPWEEKVFKCHWAKWSCLQNYNFTLVRWEGRPPVPGPRTVGLQMQTDTSGLRMQLGNRFHSAVKCLKARELACSWFCCSGGCSGSVSVPRENITSIAGTKVSSSFVFWWITFSKIWKMELLLHPSPQLYTFPPSHSLTLWTEGVPHPGFICWYTNL